jgi:hypothetical protein
MIPAELTEAEQLLCEAFPRGAWVDLGGASADGAPGVVRAEVIAALLLGGVPAERGGAAGVRLRGAAVTGPLRLMGGTAAWPLRCEDCLFDAEVDLVDSSVRTVAITGSDLPAFDGTRLRLDGLLDLAGSRIAGCVRLEHAKVSGQLSMRAAVAGTAPGAPSAGGGAEAVAATGLSVDGDLDCEGMEARGGVSLEGATVTGIVKLRHARIAAPGGRALVLSYATIGGKLDCRGLAVDGETRAINCQVAGQLSMTAARLSNPGGMALFAGGLRVSGGAFFSMGFSAQGALRLIGAHFGANLTIEGGTFDNPGGTALNLDRAVTGSVSGDDLTCHGEFSMIGARIGGDLNLARAVLDAGAGRRALDAERAQVDGILVLKEAKALGEVNLRSVRVGERLLVQRAELRNPTHTAFRVSRAQVTSDMFCDGLTVAGRLRLGGTVVGGSFTLQQVVLANPGGIVLDGKGLRAWELVLWPAAPVEGEVDLRNAVLGSLRDDPATWPQRLRLDGLTYQSLEPLLPAAQRLRWLAGDPDGCPPQPYEQLAAYYTALGQPGQGRAVLYARERVQRRGKSVAARAWSMLQDVTVGYGYRPRRALAWIGILLAAGSVPFSVTPPPPFQADAAPHFNGIVYTLDLMLPVVNLGQKYAFNPSGPEQWLSYFFIAAGWTLATTVAAGAARVLQRG